MVAFMKGTFDDSVLSWILAVVDHKHFSDCARIRNIVIFLVNGISLVSKIWKPVLYWIKTNTVDATYRKTKERV